MLNLKPSLIGEKMGLFFGDAYLSCPRRLKDEKVFDSHGLVHSVQDLRETNSKLGLLSRQSSVLFRSHDKSALWNWISFGLE